MEENTITTVECRKLRGIISDVTNWNNHKNQDRYTLIRKEAEAWQEEDRRKKRVRSM